jgi:hypothetical protein
VVLLVGWIQNRTETLSAQAHVVVRHGPFDARSTVELQFEDGSADSVSDTESQALFDAVQGHPGTARVTRNKASDSIYEVRFRGKTYKISSHRDDLVAAIIALVLGLFGSAWLLLTRDRSGTEAAAAERY